MKEKVLDKGFIEVIDTLGNDLTAVNSARVSFGNRKSEWDASDDRLVAYLAKNEHTSPFRHIQVQFHVKAPEFVMRQLYKHVVGIETTSTYSTKDHAWNEISGRYVENDEFYHPVLWRIQSTDNKQASDGNLEYIQNQLCINEYIEYVDHASNIYHRFLDRGVAREQARLLLPGFALYTEVYWTASFQSIMNFLELRDHDHAQWEIREYAMVMKEMMHKLFPKITSAWFENRS